MASKRPKVKHNRDLWEIFEEEEANRMLDMRIGVDQIRDTRDRWK